MTNGPDRSDVVSPSVAQAATVGLPLILGGVGLGAVTVRPHDWIAPLLVSGAITLVGGIRSIIWARRARALTIRLWPGRVKVSRGAAVVVDVAAGDIQASEFVRSSGSILFSPNSTVPTVVLGLNGQSIDVPLWMPYEPQIERLERLWRDYGLPG